MEGGGGEFIGGCKRQRERKKDTDGGDLTRNNYQDD